MKANTAIIINIILSDDRTEEKSNHLFKIHTTERIESILDADEWFAGWDKSSLMDDQLWEEIYNWKVIRIEDSFEKEIKWASLNRRTKMVMERERKRNSILKTRRRVLLSKEWKLIENLIEIDILTIDVFRLIRDVIRTKNGKMYDEDNNLIATTRIAMAFDSKPQRVGDRITIHIKGVDYSFNPRLLIAYELKLNIYKI